MLIGHRYSPDIPEKLDAGAATGAAHLSIVAHANDDASLEILAGRRPTFSGATTIYKCKPIYLFAPRNEHMAYAFIRRSAVLPVSILKPVRVTHDGTRVKCSK